METFKKTNKTHAVYLRLMGAAAVEGMEIPNSFNVHEISCVFLGLQPIFFNIFSFTQRTAIEKHIHVCKAKPQTGTAV